MENKPTKIGITGGIGSGKSYVCQRLEQVYATPVYDCDSRAKNLMHTDAHIRESLKRMVGDDVYGSDGALNRPLLAAYIFGNEKHLAAVNALVHPRVKEDFLAWAEEQRAEVVAVESAILFSSGLDEAVDYVLSVTAPKEVRIARVLERDACSRTQVEVRMDSQRKEEGECDFVLVNDGDRSVDEQLDTILKDVKKNIDNTIII